MPRFFFDIADGTATTQDEVGLVLPDLECAKREALVALPDLALETRDPHDGRAWSVTSTIRTEAGRAVFQATLSLQAKELAS